eukprot:scaffold63_cov306-Pinguiococcus_pyrenoidosus.AAC.64
MHGKGGREYLLVGLSEVQHVNAVVAPSPDVLPHLRIGVASADVHLRDEHLLNVLLLGLEDLGERHLDSLCAVKRKDTPTFLGKGLYAGGNGLGDPVDSRAYFKYLT